MRLPKNLNATKIDLSGLDIKEIPNEVYLYKNLRKLILRNNKIKRIPQEIKNLKLLSVLDLSNNELTSLQAKLFDLKKLRILIINNNKIKSIPSQLKNLNRLRILGIANNRIEVLNNSFEFLQELRELNLSGNNFKDFPIQILKLYKLERLWIKQDGLKLFAKKDLIQLLPSLKKIFVHPQSEIFKQMSINNEVSKLHMKKKIFISYSHQDIDWLRKVKVHLKGLSLYSPFDFEIWDDEKILSGQRWKEEIKKALKECTAAILLISSDFLASDFILNEELQPLLNKAENEGTMILQLIINPCGFKRINSLNIFQTVNDPEKEILTKLSKHEQDEVFERLTDDIETHINN